MGGTENFMGGLDNSLETMRWINTLFKCSIRKIFGIKNVLQITMMIQE